MITIKVTKEITFPSVEKMRDYLHYDAQAVMDGNKAQCIESYKTGLTIESEHYRDDVKALTKITVKVGELH